jgi:hypothetical protein
MKKFDSNNFKNLPLDERYSHCQSRTKYRSDAYYRTDKEFIHVDSNQDQIIVRKWDIASCYTNVEVYSAKTKSLIREGKNFTDTPVGIWKTYDENGKLIQENDADKNYPFSLEDLIAKMKKEYNIDLCDGIINYVRRFLWNLDTNRSFYEVRIVSDYSLYEFFLFDGKNGKLLVREPGPVGDEGYEEGESLIRQYLDSLNKQK